MEPVLLDADYLDEIAQRIESDLTTADRAELGRYEAVIKRGLGAFIEVGSALAEIRNGRLYRGTHATFEEYCEQRWGIMVRRAYQLIDAAAVVGNIVESEEDVKNFSHRESHVAPLAKLPADQQRGAWQRAQEIAGDKPPKTAQVEKAVAEFAPPSPPKEQAARPAALRYASVRELEVAVHGWVATAIGEGGVPDAETVLSNLKWQCDEPLRPGGWYDLLSTWLDERNIHFEISDLHRAIADALQHRRQDKARAAARKVYVEPTPVAPALNEDAIVLHGPEAIAAKLRHVCNSLGEEADVLLGDLLDSKQGWYHDLLLSYIPPTVEPETLAQVARQIMTERKAAFTQASPAESIIDPAWITHTLARAVQPDNADFATARQAASREQLVAALSGLSTEDKHAAEREQAIKERLRELDAPAQPTEDDRHQASVRLLISSTIDITTTLPMSLHWAIKQATVEDLQAALAALPADLRTSRGPVLEYALRKRGVKVEPPPAAPLHVDSAERLGLAADLHDLLLRVRHMAREHYGDLTGRHTDLLEFERGIEKMVPPLERLITTLGGSTE